MVVSALLLASAALAAPPQVVRTARRADWGADAVATVSVRILHAARIGADQPAADQSAPQRSAEVSGEDGRRYPAIIVDFE